MAIGAAMDVRFEQTVEAFMQFCRELGLDHVELKAEYLQGHPNTPSPAKLGELTAEYDMSLSFHAPFRDWNLGSFNDRSARASVEQVKTVLDSAATAGSDAVVVHGGSVPRRYPEWVRAKARTNAIESLTECAEYADSVGVQLCLENQPPDPNTERYTVTPAALAETVSAVDVNPDALGITLDVGHANLLDTDWREFVERFGERISVCHLHDNDGINDTHDPLTDYRSIVDTIDTTYNVFEMKSTTDIEACLTNEPTTPQD